MTNSSKIKLERNQWGRVVATLEDKSRFEDVSIVPLFPISDPSRWISVIARDGKEVAAITDPALCDAEIQELLTEELTYRDFVPRISRVLSVSGTSEPCEWHVETNHGPTKFVLKAEDDIRRLSVHEVMILDANGGRFRVDDTRKLDPRSRRFIEWYV
jgi:Domain of unknown function (DUF1854)